uniref:Glycosyltransferase family 10 protein n=1 Tax=Panagrellus redivivus TaxID=6233 RepID=A0A7E4ZR27_PANRE
MPSTRSLIRQGSANILRTRMKKPIILLLICGCVVMTTIVYFTDVTKLDVKEIINAKFDVYEIINDVVNVIDDDGLNTEPVADIRPHGDLLCVWWNFTTSTAQPNDDDATLSVHGTVGYSKFVFDHVAHWNGFISGSFSVDNTSFPALVAYRQLYKCNPIYEKTVRTHIVWWRLNSTCDSDYVMNGMEEAASNMTGINSCDLADYEGIFKNSKMSTIYKANAMRNIARIGAQTDIQLIADIENHFCDNASIIASKFADDVRNGTAVVVRRFEYSDTVEVPRNISALDDLFKKQLAFEFHHFYYKWGHEVPHLKEWVKYSINPENPTSLDPVKYRSNIWEPQLIVHRDHPYHHERVPFGYSDQAVLPHVVCRAGIEFKVGSHIFSGHRSIRRRKSYNSRRNKEGNAGYAKTVGRAYEKELAQKYPNTTKRCGKWA